MVDPESKKRIVIASILKPVDDIRMTGKIGLTLADTGKFEIDVIGFPSAARATSPSAIRYHPLPDFKRLSFSRLCMPWKVRSMIASLKPEILIITTHELLLVSLTIKMLTGCKVIYDVQENYYRNIRYTDAFPRVFRNALAAYVRIKEWIFSPFINHFFLAERSYPDETSFFGNRYSVVENKVRRSSCRPHSGRNRSQLLFTGTLSESTGVFIAIDLAAKLHAIDSSVRLTIIGYCSRERELQHIRKEIEHRSFITLIGGDRLVPHDAVLEQIDQAGIGIISYPPNPSTHRATPTKLFEYLGNTLPVLLINNPFWVEICRPYHAAVIFEPSLSDSGNLYHSIKNALFYPTIPSDVYWESEETKVIQAVLQLC